MEVIVREREGELGWFGEIFEELLGLTVKNRQRQGQLQRQRFWLRQNDDFK
jgi:hypothetical protein